ncbi:XRN 5'-3' exonuclease N-terminus-domain-containing protein [Lipomyces kononenkoae]|uniref:XRN 5'-3' exonuclease N-terminus-domain-containing protein n=1 Tax=Lipomyces kononenkoae TaxID=34357 RepID=A0ACC3SW34_LIPKO
MGIPKFFRWISERYPLISQLIEGDKIPEFDNLYLDMNGILHNCTHKDSDDATFRMSEDQMFIAIFSYIELLFDKVKPKKVFFMAVDGVAPRAKMNQQRSRRFRTALDAELAVKKATREGTTLPKEPPFDTNAITPGTEFMSKLSTQLHYFISKKVSEDSRWQNVEIVLSGHEVPGEGEHKIMEYIRAAKTQSDYNANTRHCLYGLDADLIMLGLLSHDPHFCLLREEVLFGPARKKPKELFHQQFYLLHLSLVREYLELEFQDVKHQLQFAYDFERVVDDFILLCVFVGNDFLPNLPQLHINEGALTVMFDAYKRALPKCTTYLTDSGTINLENMRFLLKELVDFEFKLFEAENDDLLYMESKAIPNGRKSKRSKLEMTPRQKMIFDSVENFLLKVRTDKSQRNLKWELPLFAVQDDLQFIETMAGKLSLDCSLLDMPSGQIVSLQLEDAVDSDDTDEEAEYALQRVLSQYRSAPIQEEIHRVTDKEPSGRVLKMFNEWKDKYYKSKLGFSYSDEQEVTGLCQNYVQGLQWVLNYYYKGLSSWSWFFRFHYSPRVSDISKGLSADMTFNIGVPFRPFEQLMGVLPDRSSQLIPIAYRSLMHDPNSPIIEFYPKEFELDLNGKKQDWEAVVKIPFVDQERLLKAMQPFEKQLTPAERKRNTFGKMIKFSYDPNMNEVYASSLQDVFPDIPQNHCHISEFRFPPMAGRQYQSGLGKGVKLGAHALAGFPTLHTIPHTAALTTRHSVNVFQQDSRREAMIVSLDDVFEELTTEQIAAKRLETKVYVGWPYIREAMIIEISDETFAYSILHENSGGTRTSHIVQSPMTPADVQTFDIKRAAIYTQYAKLGVDIGTVDVLAKVILLSGLKQLPNGALVKEYDWTPSNRLDYAMQTILTSVVNEDERYKEKPAPLISEQFPVGTRAFYLGEEAYAQPLQVLAIHGAHHADVFVAAVKAEDVMFGTAIAAAEQKKVIYYPSIDICRALHIPSLLLSKIAASYSVTHGEQESTANIGLNLKFEGKKQKVLGYTRRSATGWEYSDKAKNLIMEYQTKFPDLFEGLKKEIHTDRPSISTVLGVPDKVAQKRLEEIKAWLKSAESGRMDRVPLDSEQLLPESVEEIEKRLDECVGNIEPGEPITIDHVPQAALLKPSDATHKLGHQRFALGDRIVYVKDSGNVPIASKGTVIGITTADGRRVLDVVFDVTFLGGTDLGGRCSPDRGMTVECSSVVNLTTKQLLWRAPYNQSNGRGRGVGHGQGHGRGRGRGRGRGGRGGHE